MMLFRFASLGLMAAVVAPLGAIAPAWAQAAPTEAPVVRQPMTVLSDVQEANNLTGIITARGNVQVDYPARQLQATSAQAQYFSNERRLIMSGDVYIQQEGNSLRAETVTYFIDEARTIALPQAGRQVEAIYLVPETAAPIEPGALTPVPLPPNLQTPASSPAAEPAIPQPELIDRPAPPSSNPF